MIDNNCLHYKENETGMLFLKEKLLLDLMIKQRIYQTIAWFKFLWLGTRKYQDLFMININYKNIRTLQSILQNCFKLKEIQRIEFTKWFDKSWTQSLI